MKTQLLLVLLCLFFFSALWSQNFDEVEITHEQVSDNLYVLFGAGGNIGVISGPDGHVLIDDQFEELGEKISDKLESLHPGMKVKYCINTHYHYDHSDGNKYFGARGSEIIAHNRTRDYLSQDMSIGLPGNEPTIQKALPEEALPGLTFAEKMVLHLNGKEIHLIHIPSAHTDTDLVVYLPEENILHGGDIFVRYGVPFIDSGQGGSFKGMMKAAEELLSICNQETILIPGHGFVSTYEDLQGYRDMLFAIWDNVKGQKEKGLSLVEVQDTKPAEDYEGSDMMKDYVTALIYEELDSSEN